MVKIALKLLVVFDMGCYFRSEILIVLDFILYYAVPNSTAINHNCKVTMHTEYNDSNFTSHLI